MFKRFIIIFSSIIALFFISSITIIAYGTTAGSQVSTDTTSVDTQSATGYIQITSISPANNDANIPSDSVIKINFDQNVIDPSISDSNKTFFVLNDSSGKQVPITVVMPEQVNADGSSQVSILPVSLLSSNQNYTITVKSGIVSMNGFHLESDYNSSFIVSNTSNKTSSNNNKTTAPQSSIKNTKSNITPILILISILLILCGIFILRVKLNKK